MKSSIIVICVLLGIFFSSFVVGAATPLEIKGFKGPTEIELGEEYVYSAIVEGEYSELDWSATGGKVLDKWWEGNRYMCRVQWLKMNPDDPTKLKIWGVDKETDEVKAERLYVSLKGTSRGLKARRIKSEGGKCLEVLAEDLGKNGGRVQIRECNDAAQQKWSFDDAGRLVSSSGKCLDVHADDVHKDGGNVQIWECNDAAQQKWKWDELDRLVNGGGKCLDVHLPDYQKDGGKVQIWECNEAPQQKWMTVD